MITIGLRASPHALVFAVFDTTKRKVLNIEEIAIPAALSVPEGLKYVRSNILDVLREYSVERAGIRVTEPNAQSPNIRRIELEGVLQEAFASSNLKSYYVGQISSISARIGIARNRFKPMVEGENDLNIDDWAGVVREGREALLCAMGAEHA